MNTEDSSDMAMPAGSSRIHPWGTATLQRLEHNAVVMMDHAQANKFQRTIVLDILEAELRPGLDVARSEVHSTRTAQRVVARAIWRLVERVAVVQSVLEPGELERLINVEIGLELGEPVLSIDDSSVWREAAFLTDPGPSVEEIAEESEFERWAAPQIAIDQEAQVRLGLWEMYLNSELSKEQLEEEVGMPYQRAEDVIRRIDGVIDAQMRRLRKQFYRDVM